MRSNLMISYADGIHAVDALYVRPGLAAIHVIVENGQVAFFDCGTNASMPQVLGALAHLGVSPAAVDYVMPSHVHLDHAGGAGAMMAAFPNAKLVVHPRGARHMVDPSKLVEGAKAVYGEEKMRTLYGDLLPMSPERIIEATDGISLDLGGRRLTVLDMPGHAKHHICLVDEKTGHIFTGDAFGLSYRELDVDGRASIFPVTSPVQFDPKAMHASIDRILQAQPAAIYLAHYSRVTDILRLGADLHRLIDAHCDLARKAVVCSKEERHAWLLNGLHELLIQEKTRQGWQLADSELLNLLGDELEVNAQGLEVWLDSMER